MNVPVTVRRFGGIVADTAWSRFSLAGAAGAALANLAGWAPWSWGLFIAGVSAGATKAALRSTDTSMSGGSAGADSAQADPVAVGPELDVARADAGSDRLRFGVSDTVEVLTVARGVETIRVELASASCGFPVAAGGIVELPLDAESMTTIEFDDEGVEVARTVEGRVAVTVMIRAGAGPTSEVVEVCRDAHMTGGVVGVAVEMTAAGELLSVTISSPGVGELCTLRVTVDPDNRQR